MPPSSHRDDSIEPLVEARGVAKRFGAREVLHDADLAVRPGEIVTIIGPNGAGKSTLLRILLGLAEADRGEVCRRSGLRIGYMPQRLAVDPTLPLTVARFLTLGGRRTRTRLEEVLDEVGARGLLDQPIQALSGGEQQRVLLARALLGEPDLLALDEPMQGVDVNGQAELYALIASIRERHGCGILLISHDLHLVMAATDHVICLNHHVCCSGHPEAVSRHPEYLSLVGVRLDGGLALYAHDHNHDHPRSPACEECEHGR